VKLYQLLGGNSVVDGLMRWFADRLCVLLRRSFAIFAVKAVTAKNAKGAKNPS